MYGSEIKNKILLNNMKTKKIKISKDLLHGMFMAIVAIAVGVVIVWALGSMGDSMQAQLLGQ
jgi:hypothetical protein